MRSATSSSERIRRFYPALWKKNMARFWPIWVVYGLGWMVGLPMNLLLNAQSSGTISGLSFAQYFAQSTVRELAASPTMMTTLCFALLAAMAVFSYLYNSRSVAFFHALPLRREDLFLTNYLSGLSFLVLPAAAVFLVTLLSELGLGALDLRGLLVWLLAQVLLSFFFFSFAAFLAMFTGHILALPAFYGILNGLAVGLLYLVNQVLSSFVYGYVNVGRLNELCLWLSPPFRLGDSLALEYEWQEVTAQGNRLTQVQFHGMGTIFIYALVGLVLTAAALYIYRRRHLEGAGDVVTVAWTKPYTYIYSALSVGQFLYQFFRYSLPKGGWPPAGFPGGVGRRGLLCGRNAHPEEILGLSGELWKGCVALCLAFTALIAVMELDLTGFERRVPEADRVVSVSLYPGSNAPYDSGDNTIASTDPQMIEAVIALHQAMIDEQSIHESDELGSHYETRYLAGAQRIDVQTAGSSRVELTYTLIGGDVIQRSYDIHYDTESLADPASAAGRLDAILNRPEVILKQYFPTEREELLAEGTLRLTGISLDVYNTEQNQYETYPIPVGWREELIQAIKDDIGRGDLGRRYLLEDMERLENCYYTDLQITYEWSDPEKGERYGAHHPSDHRFGDPGHPPGGGDFGRHPYPEDSIYAKRDRHGILWLTPAPPGPAASCGGPFFRPLWGKKPLTHLLSHCFFTAEVV